MKYLALFILPLALLACNNGSQDNGNGQANSDSEEIHACDCRDLIFDEAYNSFYLEEPRKGFTGNCEELFPNGQVSLSKNFNEGKIHGKMINYYENGAVREEQEFDMNFQTGDHIKYAEDGRVIFHAVYERGRQKEILVTPPPSH